MGRRLGCLASVLAALTCAGSSAIAHAAPEPVPTATAGTPADAAPTDAAPTDAAPTDAAPTDAAPTDAAPTDAAPTDAAPTDAAPTDGPARSAEPQLSPAETEPAATATPAQADATQANGAQANGAQADAAPSTEQAAFALVDTAPKPRVQEEPVEVTPSPAAQRRLARAGRLAARARFPRLVVAAGPFIGPHALGNEECRIEVQRCEKRGTFFGMGAQVEVRGRLYKPLYAHVRGLAAGNISPNERVYSGVVGGGFGLGAYSRRIFSRAELLVLGTLGDDHFTPPFHAEATGRDQWGRVAGLISAGVRQPFGDRLSAELWGGLMIGPKSVRTVPSATPDERVLTTFVLGFNIAFDAIR